MPVTILAAGYGMKINDCVDSLRGAEVDGSVKPFEAFGLEDSGVHVILEMAVVDGDSDAVEPQRLVELCVFLGEEVFEILESHVNIRVIRDIVHLANLVKEVFCLLVSDGFSQCLANLIFSSRETGDEVLHVHPTTNCGLFLSERGRLEEGRSPYAAQDDLVAISVHNDGSFDFEDTARHGDRFVLRTVRGSS